MALTLIPADHYKTRKIFQKNGDNFLKVSEFYADTIQGEGPFIGLPATFLRLTGCSLDCKFCDTTEVWNQGTNWTYKELLDLIEDVGIQEKLFMQQHLVITGGSPLLQQRRILGFLQEFTTRFGFRPYVELENECVIKPMPQLFEWINYWINSPKLKNSGVPFEKRFNRNAIGEMAYADKSWFKFVIDKVDYDWIEIEENYLKPFGISKSRVILMPQGQTREEILEKGPQVAELAIKQGVRYCSREHIVRRNKKIGV